MMCRHCVNLVSLRLGIVSDDQCYSSHHTILLPHLESLTVFVDMDKEYFWPFVLPSLNTSRSSQEMSQFGPMMNPPR